MNRNTLLRCLGAYALIAILGVPAGWALAQRHRAAAVPAVGGLDLVAAVSGAGTGPVQAPVHGPKDVRPHAFTMSGGVRGLVPGRWMTLPVLVTNPNSQPMKVLTIRVTAKDASRACPATGNLAVLGYDATARGATVHIVPGGGRAVVPLSIELVNAPNRNQNACKGVSFALSYVGSAVQWGH
jgi:hypothetical protein